MTTAYRLPYLVPPSPVAEHRGPRRVCPYCGASEKMPFTRACVGVGWWRRLWGGCARRSPHLHQLCRECDGQWTCAPQETP